MAKRLPKVLTDSEQTRMLELCNPRYQSGMRNRAMIRFALGTGLRAGELVALKPEHLELDQTGGRVVVREGKGAKDRFVWFGWAVRDDLGRWMERRPESPWVFCTAKGGQLSPRYLRTMVKRLAHKAGVAEADKVSPHTLRHTFASDMYRATKDLAAVQKALGHASITTTMIYTHISDDVVERAMRDLRDTPPYTITEPERKPTTVVLTTSEETVVLPTPTTVVGDPKPLAAPPAPPRDKPKRRANRPTTADDDNDDEARFQAMIAAMRAKRNKPEPEPGTAEWLAREQEIAAMLKDD